MFFPTSDKFQKGLITENEQSEQTEEELSNKKGAESAVITNNSKRKENKGNH